MWRVGCNGATSTACSGFTLFEMLVVMVVAAMTLTAVSTLYRSPSSVTQIKATALLAASRLRDLRSAAMTTGSERVATIDAGKGMIEFSDGRGPITFNRSIGISVTGAESEKRSATRAGVRFFPNGSSTGATILLTSESQAYEVRINWLTGRVSTSAIN